MLVLAGTLVDGISMQSTPAPSPRLSRRTLLRATGGMAVGVPALATTDALLITPGWLSTTSLDLPPRRPAEGAAETRAATRLVQLSDLHLKTIGRLEEQILSAINKDPPDLLVVTGDAFDSARGVDVFAEFLAACPTRTTILGILGNWEYRSGIAPQQVARVYEQHGGRLLINESLTVDTSGGRLRVTGLDDLVEGRPRAEVAQPAERAEPHLLLAHCPGQRDQLGPHAQEEVDLILSGHTHGGQVAPFGIALLTPGGSGRYIRGWYEGGGPPMYVSRGLGMSTLPIRLGVTPELVEIRWRLS